MPLGRAEILAVGTERYLEVKRYRRLHGLQRSLRLFGIGVLGFQRLTLRGLVGLA